MVDDVRMEDIHEPQTAPDGRWVFQVTSGKFRENTHDKGPESEGFFVCRPVEAKEVVDDDFDIETLSPVFHSIPKWKQADLWNVKRFLLTLGLTEEEMEGASLEEACEAAKGRFFEATITTARPEGSDYDRTTVKGVAKYTNGVA